MLGLVHPLWGRDIESYSVSTDRNQKKTRVTLSIDSELAGLRAMQKISQLSSQSNSCAHRNQLDIPTLQCALQLSLDPATIRHLANPPTIGGCVYLLKALNSEVSDSVSLFKFEYGYLCMRLLATTLALCLLDRWGELDRTLEHCDQGRFLDSGPLSLILERLSSVVERRAKNAQGRDDYEMDQDLITFDPFSKRPPLLLESDVSAVLGILWDNRKYFLRAIVSATIPGLPGVTFLLWRYVVKLKKCCDTTQPSSQETLDREWHELVMRQLLVVDESQSSALLSMVDPRVLTAKSWTTKPKHVDQEDSRLILNLFIKGLAQLDHSRFKVRDPYTMLGLIPYSIDTGAQDLMPEVMRLIIEYTWSNVMFIENSQNVGRHARWIFGSLCTFIRPSYDEAYRLTPLTRRRTLDVMQTTHMLDVVARVLVILMPGGNESSAEHMLILAIIMSYFDTLAEVIPRHELESWSEDYILEWQKTKQYLTTMMSGAREVVTIGHRGHYERCLLFWDKLARALALRTTEEREGTVMECSNPRCPTIRSYSHVTGGSRFRCAGCPFRVYCDSHCQAIDWELDSSHRKSCGNNKEKISL